MAKTLRKVVEGKIIEASEARSDYSTGREVVSYVAATSWRRADTYLVYGRISDQLLGAVSLPTGNEDSLPWLPLRILSDGKLATGGTPCATLAEALQAL